MSEFRILDFNYIFDDGATITASSEALDFPITNVRSHLRSKVWRSGGYFVVTTSNYTIDFDDGAGAISGNLTPGAYTAAELVLEIKQTLDVAGPATHTVTYDNGKFNIAADGASFSFLWSSGAGTAVTAATLLGFDRTSDSTGSLEYESAFAVYHTEEWIEIDLGSPEAIDSFAMIFDAVDGCQLSESAVVKIQANVVNAWDTPIVNVTLTLDEDYEVFTNRWSSDQTYRYWRIYFQDISNANGCVEIGNIFLTKATQLSQMPSIGFSHTLGDRSKRQENDYGNEFFDIYPSRREFTFNHTALTEADLETLYQIYERVGRVVPICVWLDPAATLYDKDRFFLYGRLRGDFKATHSFYTFFDQELTLVEAL